MYRDIAQNLSICLGYNGCVRNHILISILITLPFLGIELSPLNFINTWATSGVIWAIWLIILGFYNKQFIMRLRFQSPITTIGRQQ